MHTKALNIPKLFAIFDMLICHIMTKNYKLQTSQDELQNQQNIRCSTMDKNALNIRVAKL